MEIIGFIILVCIAFYVVPLVLGLIGGLLMLALMCAIPVGGFLVLGVPGAVGGVIVVMLAYMLMRKGETE